MESRRGRFQTVYEDTVVNRSPFAQFTPRELYLKFLYEYFQHGLNRPAELEDIYVPMRRSNACWMGCAPRSKKRRLANRWWPVLEDAEER